ncbi:Thioredoxin-like protein 4A [Camelus dromedarius]|uniref:Thioredoxin-like protein 4A n=1 Tax=Camelus dromedarius TaxID=9838 RepID=A0A5N4E6S8_CAMDR|nr:Thioredoxin-like protein 4A [Camelus dromedarius]
MDKVLSSTAEKVKNFAIIYLVDVTEVPDFNKMYVLYAPRTVVFFFRNKHIPIDLGTGNSNSNMIIWATRNKQTIDAIETMYQGAWKGRGPVVISERLLHEIQTQQDKQLGPGKESGAGSQLKSSTCQEGEVATWSDVVSSSLITKQTP